MKIYFSIITVTYNSKKNLLKTIDSVQSQTYKKFSHIIKDGLSSDKTNEIDFSGFKNTKFYESKDKGVYDAMNQASDYIENEFVIFLNSGDFFLSKNTLKEIAINIKKQPNFFAYSGGTLQIDQAGKKFKRLMGYSNLYKILPFSQLPHPSFVIRKSILIKLQKPFDAYLRIAGDYKQQLLMRKKNIWKVCHLKQIITIMPLGGISNKNTISILEGYKETFDISFKLFSILSFYIIFLKFIFYFYSIINLRKLKKIKLNISNKS